MKYLNKLNLDSDLTFGTEIEFNGPMPNEFYDNNKDLPIELIINHFKQKLAFDKWYIDGDVSLYQPLDEEPNGGELSSKIMHNEELDWKELELFCERLKESSAYITKRCSNHVSIGTEPFQYDKKFFYLLAKVIATFENEIKLFSYGEFLSKRHSFDNLSNCMQMFLINKIASGEFPTLDMDYSEFMRELCKNKFEIWRFKKNHSIHFDFYHGLENKQTLSRANQYDRIEFRYPNGSINPVIIQNNINFFLKIVCAILHNRFDEKYLDYVISRYIKNNSYLIEGSFSVENMNKLMSSICLGSDDRDNFGEQFERVRSIKGIRYIK